MKPRRPRYLLARNRNLGALSPAVGISIGLGFGAVVGFIIWYLTGSDTEDILAPSTPVPNSSLREEGFRAGRSVGMINLMHVGPAVMSIQTGTAFLAMAAAAKAEAGLDLMLGLWKLSGFRTMAQQTETYKNPPVSPTTGLPSRVAKPGFSNHQGGVAVDIGTANSESSPVFLWLVANAYRFGFDHAEGKSVNEPWHWTHLASTLPFV